MEDGRMNDAMTERVALVMSRDLISRIDEWRRKQKDLPTRAAASRRLIEHALAIDRVQPLPRFVRTKFPPAKADAEVAPAAPAKAAPKKAAPKRKAAT
jgi:hypothetical protein